MSGATRAARNNAAICILFVEGGGADNTLRQVRGLGREVDSNEDGAADEQSLGVWFRWEGAPPGFFFTTFLWILEASRRQGSRLYNLRKMMIS